MKTKALVVLSGGQDSVTTLFLAKQKYDEVYALTFDYGQRHAIEIEAAKKTAEMAEVVSHEIVKLGPILTGKSFLTDKEREVETFKSFEEMSHHNAFKENKLDSSFVPMRNPLFLTIAANRAAVLECDALYTGVTAADFAEYGEFSWEWLGGFIDAEGCISTSGKDKSSTLSIYQNDPELMHRIKRWVCSQIEDISSPGNVSIAKDGNACLCWGAKASQQILNKVSAHLHLTHRRQQAIHRGFSISAEAEITDAYAAGLWEGDGGCWSTQHFQTESTGTPTPEFVFYFYQKDSALLERISQHFGRRATPVYSCTSGNDFWTLSLSDGLSAARILNRLRSSFCVLGSFKKITKWRHRIGFDAGGFNPPYPDCTPDFIRKFELMMNESLRSPFTNPIKIETPLMFLTKAQSVRLARTLPGCMEALAYSHTSYAGIYPPTVNDHATVLRAQGFLEAGVPDPLIVRAFKEGLMALPTTSNYDQVA